MSDKLTTAAVEKIRNDWCREFFADRKEQPNRKFCQYFEQQDRDVLSTLLDQTDNGGEDTFYTTELDIGEIDIDTALMQQDRRFLTADLILPSTMRSFQANDSNLNAPACVVRKTENGYLPGDGRHRLVWSVALGCKKANAWVVETDDDNWNHLREMFNNLNGAQRTEEERLHLVYRKMQQGGFSIKDLCKSFGVPLNKFYEFQLRQKLSAEAEDRGLAPTQTTPNVVLKKAIELIDKRQDKKRVQALINESSRQSEVSRPLLPLHSKQLDALFKSKELNTDESIEELITEIKKAKRKRGARGPNKATVTKFAEGIETATKATKKGLPAEIGMAATEIRSYKSQVQSLFEWLGKKRK